MSAVHRLLSEAAYRRFRLWRGLRKRYRTKPKPKYRVYFSNCQRTRTAGLFAVCRVIFPWKPLNRSSAAEERSFFARSSASKAGNTISIPAKKSLAQRENFSLPFTSCVFRYTLGLIQAAGLAGGFDLHCGSTAALADAIIEENSML